MIGAAQSYYPYFPPFTICATKDQQNIHNERERRRRRRKLWMWRVEMSACVCERVGEKKKETRI